MINDVGQQILQVLEKQAGHYRTMKQAIEKQTAYIEAMDIGGLSSGTSETRALMRKIRDLEAALRPLRQSWQNFGLDQPVLEKRKINALVAEIRSVIEEIQAIKEKNKAMLERSMDKLRKQMTGLKTGSKAARAYHHRPVLTPAARFIDRSK